MESVIANRPVLGVIDIAIKRGGQRSIVKVSYPSDEETAFGLRGIAEMPARLAKQVEEAHDAPTLAKLGDAAAAAGDSYIAGWLYLHAADRHDKDASRYTPRKGARPCFDQTGCGPASHGVTDWRRKPTSHRGRKRFSMW